MSPPATPTDTPPTDTLEVEDLCVDYGKSVRALHAVSLRVPAGAIVSLLGANGAGKSTLLRAISGTLPLHRGAVVSGSVRFGGRVLTGRPSADAVAAGVVQAPEGRRVFTGLSVEDNLRAGRLGVRRGSRHRTRRGTRQDAREAMERVYTLFPVLAERRRQSAGLLSGGEQQMLAMGRALMARPRLLLLDEPSLGLAPQIAARIAEIVERIHGDGTSVLLVEQNAALALRLADHAYVLDVGRVRLQGSAAELAASDQVRRLYLGEDGDTDRDAAGTGVRGDVRRPALSRWAG